MADETKRVEVFMGPYRNTLLNMRTAEADAAINEHWARDPFAPYDAEHGALSEQERADALAAATAWAQTQWETAGAGEPPPPEGGATRRNMGPGKPAAGYQTRHVEPKP
jgi:hypothetical protein